MTVSNWSDHAERAYAFCNNVWDQDGTVYVSTYLRSWKVTAKNRGAVRVRNGHIEMQTGRTWVGIGGCKFTAQV